jgi:hypothetical protein
VVTVSCKHCARSGRYEIVVPDNKVRVDAIQALLHEALGRPAQAEEPRVSRVPDSRRRPETRCRSSADRQRHGRLSLVTRRPYRRRPAISTAWRRRLQRLFERDIPKVTCIGHGWVIAGWAWTTDLPGGRASTGPVGCDEVACSSRGTPCTSSSGTPVCRRRTGIVSSWRQSRPWRPQPRRTAASHTSVGS